MVHRSCLFPGCCKPAFQSSSSDYFAVACGNTHHLQLMCLRFCALHPELDPELRPFYSFRASSICGIPSCNLLPSPGHAFCSKSHHLLWSGKFASKLNPQQRCRLQGCNKHVFVDLGSDKKPPKVHHFCGWKHCQEHTISNCFSSQPDEWIASHQSAEPSVTHLIPYFKSYVSDKINPSKHALVENDFFSKHPWEVLQPDQQSCIVFTMKAFKGKKGAKKRTTKDGYHWKPTSSEKEFEDGLRQKYLNYKKISGAADCSNEHKDRSCFSIKEYTLDDYPNHCIVHLYRRSQKTKPEGPVRKKMKLTRNEENLQNVPEIHPPESDNNNNQNAVILNGKEDGSPFMSSQLGMKDHNVGMSVIGQCDDMGAIADTQDGMYNSSGSEEPIAIDNANTNGMLMATAEDDATATADGMFNGGDVRTDAHRCGCRFEDDFGSSTLRSDVPGMAGVWGVQRSECLRSITPEEAPPLPSAYDYVEEHRSWPWYKIICWPL